jgi:hypothetical protein
MRTRRRQHAWPGAGVKNPDKAAAKAIAWVDARVENFTARTQRHAREAGTFGMSGFEDEIPGVPRAVGVFRGTNSRRGNRCW